MKNDVFNETSFTKNIMKFSNYSTAGLGYYKYFADIDNLDCF